MARNSLRTLAHLAPHLPALAALDVAGCRLADEAELSRLAELPALASVCLADTPLSRKPVCSSVCVGFTWDAGKFFLGDVPVNAYAGQAHITEASKLSARLKLEIGFRVT